MLGKILFLCLFFVSCMQHQIELRGKKRRPPDLYEDPVVNKKKVVSDMAKCEIDGEIVHKFAGNTKKYTDCSIAFYNLQNFGFRNLFFSFFIIYIFMTYWNIKGIILIAT